jgi:hypothetical protein
MEIMVHYLAGGKAVRVFAEKVIERSAFTASHRRQQFVRIEIIVAAGDLVKPLDETVGDIIFHAAVHHEALASLRRDVDVLDFTVQRLGGDARNVFASQQLWPRDIYINVNRESVCRIVR